MTTRSLTDDDIRYALEESFAAPGVAPVPLDPDRRIEAMGVDSLRLSQIILAIEARLDVTMPDEVLNELGRSETVGALHRTLAAHYASA